MHPCIHGLTFFPTDNLIVVPVGVPGYPGPTFAGAAAAPAGFAAPCGDRAEYDGVPGVAPARRAVTLIFKVCVATCGAWEGAAVVGGGFLSGFGTPPSGGSTPRTEPSNSSGAIFPGASLNACKNVSSAGAIVSGRLGLGWKARYSRLVDGEKSGGTGAQRQENGQRISTCNISCWLANVGTPTSYVRQVFSIRGIHLSWLATFSNRRNTAEKVRSENEFQILRFGCWRSNIRLWGQVGTNVGVVEMRKAMVAQDIGRAGQLWLPENVYGPAMRIRCRFARPRAEEEEALRRQDWLSSLSSMALPGDGKKRKGEISADDISNSLRAERFPFRFDLPPTVLWKSDRCVRQRRTTF